MSKVSPEALEKLRQNLLEDSQPDLNYLALTVSACSQNQRRPRRNRHCRGILGGELGRFPQEARLLGFLTGFWHLDSRLSFFVP